MLRKAVLILDPARRAEQFAFVQERAQVLWDSGDHLWARVEDDLVERLAAQGILVQVHEEADLVDLPSVIFSVNEGEPQVPPGLAAATPEGTNTAYWIVKFVAPPPSAWVQEVEQLGELVEDVPFFASIFRLTAQQAEQVRELPFVAFVGLYHPAYALHYPLAGREEQFTAATLREMAIDESLIGDSPAGSLQSVPFLDITSASLAPLVTAAGATVIADTGASLVVNAPAARVADLLRVPGVRLVQIQPETSLGNQRAGLISGVNQVRDFGNVDFQVNLDGTGEIGGIMDAGLDTGVIATLHADLAGRVIQLVGLTPFGGLAGTISHGTHVTGIVVASGINAPRPTPASPNNTVPRGVAPMAQVIFHSIISGPPVGGNVPLDARNFLAGFTTAYTGGARVQTNSWFIGEDSVYDATAEVVDRFTFLRSDCTILFLTGNGEGDRNGNGVLDMNHLTRQCLPKNVLAVGSCESQTNLDGDPRNYRAISPGLFNHHNFDATAGAVTPFSQSDNANEVDLNSARGRVLGNPAALRRVKPDLVAPGNNIISTGSRALMPAAGFHTPTTAPAAFYLVDSGTSMATPHVAGACLLTRQFYRTRFAELRRPLLLEQLTAFVDQPATVPHSDGSVIAWIHPDAAGPNHIVAARFTRGLVQVGNIVRLIADVGAQPAFSLVRHGTNTIVMRRAADNTIRLQCFDNALAPVNGFGTGGSVTLAPASRPEGLRTPTLQVRQDEVGVVWFETGNNNLRFQRFNALTGGPIDAASRVLGTGTDSSVHRYLIFQDNRWAAVWVLSAADHRILLRLIDPAGVFQGAQPTAIVTQAQPLREPVIVWDSAADRYVVAFVTLARNGGGDVHVIRLRPDGTPDGTATAVVLVPVGQTVRRPRLAVHPRGNAYILLWEDSTQGTFDVYTTVFEFGPPALRILRQVQISDTPLATSGFAALVDGEGIQPVWYSNDEINSDLLGVFAVRLTPDAIFRAQADPRTPLLESGHYVPHKLIEHTSTDVVQTAMVWGGGDFYVLRVVVSNIAARVTLIRTNPDGLPDTRMAPRELAASFGFRALCLHWTGDRMVACDTDSLFTNIHLLNLDGLRINTFGNGGTVLILEPSTAEISIQAGHRFVSGNLRIQAVWGRKDIDAAPARIRYAVLRADGTFDVAARDLVSGINGTARHGWFHALNTEAPFHVIAIWHILTGATFAVRLNRFQANGNPQAGQAAPIDLSAPAGDSMNAVIAPRPVLFDPTSAGQVAPTRRREFGVAWQFRTAAAAPWTILFSRLNRNGTVQATRNVQIFGDLPIHATFHATEPQLVWHTDGYGVAWLQASTAAGSAKQLVFGVRDQAGARVLLNPPPVPPPAAPPAAIPVADFAVSSPTADVQQFQLVWNGRAFRLGWTEIEGGQLRQMQRALSVPRLAGFDRVGNPRTPTFDEPFQEPSSALVRATLINGATNIANTPLPNFPGIGLAHQPLQGYGWGRLNMRQALAPAPPATFHVRDDASVAQGRTARYVFFAPLGTLLIRVTLCWTDPPGRNLVNNLNLVVTTPAFAVGGVRSYVGNRWQAAAGPLNNPQPSNPLAAPRPAPVPANTFQNVHTMEQVVITAPPALPSGDYIVEVVGTSVPDSAFQQFPGQPFSLVFVGSGNELRTVLPLPAGPLPIY